MIDKETKGRRSQLEQRMGVLAAVILSNADGEGALPTHVMYRANMSWGITSKILEKLKELELIHQILLPNGRRRLFATSRGLGVLEKFRQLNEIAMPTEAVMVSEYN